MAYFLVMMVYMTDLCTFILSKCLTTLSTWELVVDDIMEGNDNLKKKTGEDAVIRMYRLEFFWPFFAILSQIYPLFGAPFTGLNSVVVPRNL